MHIYTFRNISQTNNNHIIDYNRLFSRQGGIGFLPRLDIPLAPFLSTCFGIAQLGESRWRQKQIGVILITRGRRWLGPAGHTGERSVNDIIICYRNYNYY